MRLDVDVRKYYVNAAGDQVTKEQEVDRVVYEIKPRQLLNGQSASSIAAARVSTQATITVEDPS
jgi:hypothetical protein